MNNNTKRLGIAVDAELYRQVREAAFKLEMSVSKFFRYLAEEFIRKAEVKQGEAK